MSKSCAACSIFSEVTDPFVCRKTKPSGLASATGNGEPQMCVCSNISSLEPFVLSDRSKILNPRHDLSSDSWSSSCGVKPMIDKSHKRNDLQFHRPPMYERGDKKSSMSWQDAILSLGNDWLERAQKADPKLRISARLLPPVLRSDVHFLKLNKIGDSCRNWSVNCRYTRTKPDVPSDHAISVTDQLRPHTVLTHQCQGLSESFTGLHRFHN